MNRVLGIAPSSVSERPPARRSLAPLEPVSTRARLLLGVGFFVLFFAAWFGPLWGLMMWFSTWQSEGYSASGALFASATAGVLFGFFMALFHVWRKRANKLPDWDRL